MISSFLILFIFLPRNNFVLFNLSLSYHIFSFCQLCKLRKKWEPRKL
nr:MAG TPA: hypothetical protein [Caudoviricetes sp.]